MKSGKDKKYIHLIVGARPNFMKMAPLYRALEKEEKFCRAVIIHTGQHYDEKMSKLFFEELKMPEPEAYLEVGSGSHGKQTARIMERYEDYIFRTGKPDLVIVAGDVNSTIAAALVAKKLHIPVAHVEAGLRSYDERMPEEINRVLTDRISDILLTPSRDADENLIREGIDPEKIFFVGNIMIDSLLEHKEKAEKSTIKSRLGLQEGEKYVLITLHRPSNVDEREGLEVILDAFGEIGKKCKLIFPMHPRTKKNIEEFKLEEKIKTIDNLIITEPLGYLDFLKLEMEAELVLTDSGGIQEETTFFGVPCLTLRENTERPITISQGTNRLVRLDTESIIEAAKEAMEEKVKRGKVPELWDGKASCRIAEVIFRWLVEGNTRG
jgi:UDP-N-acetylglucosamine 2-epimerase (non-hydrolysing)